MMIEPTRQEAERLFVGSLLVDPSQLQNAKLTAQDLLNGSCRLAYQTMLDMEGRNEVIDTLSVADCMPDKNSNEWLLKLTTWADAAFTTAFFQSSQKVIINNNREQAIRRIAHHLNDDLNADVAIQALMDLNTVEKTHTHTFSDALSAAVSRTELLYQNGRLVGLPTGLNHLDAAIAGFQAPDLYVIGARPAMGKTAVALNFMLSNECPVAFFSTEQPMEQIGLRSLSLAGGVSARNLRSAELAESDWPKLINAVSRSRDKKIFIHDKPSITITDIMREARRLKYNHDIAAIYVDYIQRIKSPKAESRRLEVADVVIGLKTLARELSVPVIALAQVSREVEKRANKRPHMGDLLESGVIEQEADVVMLLYRDEVYAESHSDKFNVRRGILEIIIDKNRHGPTGSLDFAWLGEQMKVADLAQHHYRQVAS